MATTASEPNESSLRSLFLFISDISQNISGLRLGQPHTPIYNAKIANIDTAINPQILVFCAPKLEAEAHSKPKRATVSVANFVGERLQRAEVTTTHTAHTMLLISTIYHTGI